MHFNEMKKKTLQLVIETCLEPRIETKWTERKKELAD